MEGRVDSHNNNAPHASTDAGMSRAVLAAFLATSEDAVVEKTVDGIVTAWNPAAERIFGWTAAEMIGQSILKVIPPRLHDEEQEILARLRSGERLERYETTRCHKTGRSIDISLTITPLRDTGGRIIGAVKIAHDITARRQAERNAEEEARTLASLNRVGQDVAAQIDLGRIVQMVTDAATEVSGAQFGAFFYNTTTQGQDAYWLYALSGAPREAFSQFPHPRATELFGPTFRGEGVIRSDDVTQDPRYGKMAPHHGMPPGHLPVRSYLAVPVISNAGHVLGGLFFGHPAAGIFTQRSERSVGVLAAQASIAMDRANLFQQLKERESELSRLAEEREEIIEAERKARSEGERLGRVKDEFLATLSHELRTPLNAIQGWTRILLSSQRSEEDTRALQTIERNARTQGKIINDLLDMSRIISGKIHLDVQSLHLIEVIETAVATVRQSADAKGIRISQLLDSSIGLVRGDANRLQQVLWNLLSNAVKFTPSGGRISVVLERVNSHLEIVIEDNGAGITPELLPHIFDRFWQADSSISRQHGGLGLGLSIVKSLVELHGGSVRVKSPGTGLGSTFIVALPVSHVRPDEAAQLGARRAKEVPQAMELPSLAGFTLLVVDDEPDGAALLARILTDRGAEVVIASNGDEALACAARQRFDAILSDVGMPGIDGYELIRRLRRGDGLNRRIPAIAVTAYARSEDRQHALLAGFQMHISKPVEGAELVAGVASLLQVSPLAQTPETPTTF
jgi:PAS domain S-box-containing protein